MSKMVKDSFIYDYPIRVLFGPGKLKELHKETLPGKKAMVVIYAGLTPVNNTTVRTVKKELTSAGVEVLFFDKIGTNPEDHLIDAGSDFYHANKCDFIVGVGGGAILDSATLIAAVAGQGEGRMWEYVPGGSGGKKPLSKPSVPYIEITTTAGTGSDVDPFGVVSNPKTGEKVGFTGHLPIMAIVDPELMLSVPPLVTAYTGFDALYHSMEGLFNRNCHMYAEMIQKQVIYNVGHYLPRAVHNGNDLEARTKLAFASTLSGYSMQMCDCCGVHVLSNQICGFHHSLPHGLSIALISPAYYEFIIRGKGAPKEMFIEVAKLLGKHDAKDPMDMVTALRDLNEATGVSKIKMSDYGVDPANFPAMVRNGIALTPGQYEYDLVKATEEDWINILKASFQ